MYNTLMVKTGFWIDNTFTIKKQVLKKLKFVNSLGFFSKI